MRRISTLTDEALVRRGRELAYHLMEIAIHPDHPASRANGARWKREARQVESALVSRGLVSR